MKKRIFHLFLPLLAISCGITACGNGTDDKNKDNAELVKVGIGVHTDFANGTFNAGDIILGRVSETTNVQADIHVAAVMLDKDGKIVDIITDAIEINAEIDENGHILTDRTTEYPTKREQGDSYGLDEYALEGTIKKEWYQQADYFEAYCIGKTADEVAAIEFNDGYSTDKTLLVGCTIKSFGLQQAVVRACQNAIWEGASESDKLGLGVVSSIDDYSYTYDATIQKNGMVCADAHFVATTQDENNRLTCVVIDALQAKSTFDVNGKYTTDLNTEPITKYNQKEDYGMAAYGPENSINKEWYEQARFLMEYIKSTDSKTLKTNNKGKSTDPILLVGCTISISDFSKALEKSIHPVY